MIKIPQQVLVTRQKSHIHPVTKYAFFCPECGESLHDFVIINEYICEYCHHVIGENDKYCFHCGEELNRLAPIAYWCNNNELDKASFTNLVEALKLSKEDVK